VQPDKENAVEGFFVSCGDKEEFFNDVISRIQLVRSKTQFHRPILVVLNDEKQVDEFNYKFQDALCKRLQWSRPYKLTEEVIFEERSRIIALATKENSVTLVSRCYGRGTDFESFGMAVNSNGGLHVILTFLPELVSEMIQIKGRTCRQDNQGSFQEIYWKDDLVKGDNGKAPYVSEEELTEYFSHNSDWADRKMFLKQKLDTYDRNRTDNMKAKLARNQVYATLTKEMVKLATDGDLEGSMRIAKEFTFPHVKSNTHTVFVIDESGSMCPHWPSLQKSVHDYLQILLDFGNFSDFVSIIQFDSTARIIEAQISLDAAISKTLEIKGGSTNFAPALTLVKELLLQDSSESDVVIVFMTDGDAVDGDVAVDILREIFDRFLSRNPRFNAIGFTDQPKHPTLTKMVEAVGGILHGAEDGVQLVQKFVDVAQAMCVSDRSDKKRA
jgi:Mg-chelatase subunit ChlD